MAKFIYRMQSILNIKEKLEEQARMDFAQANMRLAAEEEKLQQLKDRKLWKKFVDQFRNHTDTVNAGWRGEYWGKMMRGGALVYEYSHDDGLYDVLTETVHDMLTVAENDGRVSTYDRETEFNGWDMWCRKYVILGCEYYLDICRDEDLRAEIISFIKGCADYVLAHIGNEEGKKPITDTSKNWLGMNSCSILEPFVKLYRLTGEEKYLGFATYIVEEGGAKGINIFELAYRNEIKPYQYGVSKAYEMISCFEGLLEYYYVTGIEKYKTAVINFANAVIDTEISVIGCCGITHELFDYTRARQTVRYEGESQETCVTVTWMKFCARLLTLTGDSRFADCMEQSFYNAYLSTLNVERVESPYIQQKAKGPTVYTFIPADSYSPLLSRKRGTPIGGIQFLPDGSYYGCCACIVSAGVGMFAKNIVIADEIGVTVNFFESGTYTVQYGDTTIEIKQETDYPLDGRVKLQISTDKPTQFALRIRVPSWTGKGGSYATYKREWFNDEIVVEYPMKLHTQTPEAWDEETIYVPGPTAVHHDENNDHYVTLFRGPITLAVDSRMGKAADSVFDFEPIGEICADREIVRGVPCLLKMRFTDKNGGEFYLVDYSSAGKDWNTEIAAWLRTK